ncbi:MAG: HAMP domain-containing sensor histidine kinase [Bacteroidales bacterium]
MRKKINLSAGIISIIVLVSVQAYIIGQIWIQKDELFRMKYSRLSVEALDYYENENRTNGYDTAFAYIEFYSSIILGNDILRNAAPAELDTVKSIIIEDVTGMLNEKEYLSKLLAKYFSSHNLGGNLITSVVINYFDLIDINTIQPIYVNDDYLNSRSDKSKIFVSQFRNEDNHHRISFDFYINIAGKRAILFREMLISLILSVLSIVVVVVIFILAYKNLMEERRLSELKTDFINNMTHELKTPLSTISVASKTLELEKILTDRDKIIETARMIGKQSVNLNQLINLILEISIWERAEFEPEMNQMAVGPVLTDIVRGFRAGHADSANISDSIKLEGISIRADITYFTTMINNLLCNGVKYSPKNTEVNIEAFSNGNEVIIKVADNGVGIRKGDQKLIFDKFYRVTQGDIHKTKGLGLGLYYVKRIAEAHGGRVELESQPGRGSIFTVTLPA